jgi:hypothetical protein
MVPSDPPYCTVRPPQKGLISLYGMVRLHLAALRAPCAAIWTLASPGCVPAREIGVHDRAKGHRVPLQGVTDQGRWRTPGTPGTASLGAESWARQRVPCATRFERVPFHGSLSRVPYPGILWARTREPCAPGKAGPPDIVGGKIYI